MRSKQPWYVNTIANLLGFALAVGMLWLIVWWANPNIDSGTVWVLAFIFGTLDSQLARLIVKAGA